jgi:hypothetical protein
MPGIDAIIERDEQHEKEQQNQEYEAIGKSQKSADILPRR